MGRFPIASLEMLLRRCPSWLNFYRMVRMNRLEAQQISDSTSLFDDQKRYLMFQKSKRVDMGPKDVEFGWNFQNVWSRVWSLLWGQWSSCGPSLANCVRKPIRQKICGNAKNPLAAAAWRGKVWTPLAILMEQRASQHLGDMRVDGNITSGISRTAAAVFVLL